VQKCSGGSKPLQRVTERSISQRDCSRSLGLQGIVVAPWSQKQRAWEGKMTYSSDIPPLEPVPVPYGDLPPLPGLIKVKYGKKEITLDAATGTNSEDVGSTIKAAFQLPSSARLILKRVSDGSVVVVGPYLTSGTFVVDTVKPHWRRAIDKVHQEHIPALNRHIQENYVPPVRNTVQSVSNRLTTAGTAVGESTSNFLTNGPSIMKGHLTRATRIANNHTTTNSHTWTAKLWAGLCKCAPGPISSVTGVPVEELPSSTAAPSTTAPPA